MRPSRRSLPGVLLTITIALLACVLLACGSGNNHVLQSVSVSPATATSQAQFTATGIYTTMPTSVDITGTTTWCIGSSDGVCQPGIAGQVQLVAGSAQCLQGATGTFTVLAGQAGPPTGVNGAFPLKPFGAAQLTCP